MIQLDLWGLAGPFQLGYSVIHLFLHSHLTHQVKTLELRLIHSCSISSKEKLLSSFYNMIKFPCKIYSSQRLIFPYVFFHC